MNSENFPPSVPALGLGRRQLLYGGVAGVAALGGALWAGWNLRAGAMVDGAADRFWPLTFDTPAGPPLAMQMFRGRPLLLNFWATWCPPCVAELPLLDAFYRENSPKGWQVLGLAIDQPSAVRGFLARSPVSFSVALAGLAGTELGKSLGNLGGGLPFSVVFGADGVVLHRKMGQLTPADLAGWTRLP